MDKFLVQKFGEDGAAIYQVQQAIYNELVSEIKNKSDSQKKTMTKTILPRVALYKALLRTGYTQTDAKGIVKQLMVYQLTPQANLFKKLDRLLPFFFPLFKQMFISVCKGDNWVTENIVSKPDCFRIDIVKCLWYDTCVDNGCPELCGAFCENDDLLYGSLKNTAFIRTTTIAAGNDCCNFCFKNKRKA